MRSLQHQSESGQEKRVHTWQIEDAAEKQKAGAAVIQELARLSVIPKNAEERDFLGEELWTYIVLTYWGTVEDPADRKLWETLPSIIPENDKAHRRIMRAFDTYLAGEAQVWGPKLFLSYRVIDRILEWTKRDTALLKLFQDGITNYAKLQQNERGGRFPVKREIIRKTERMLLEDLRPLFRKIRSDFGTQKTKRTNANLFEFIEKEVKSEAKSYPSLSLYVQDLGGLIKGQDSDFARKVGAGRFSPERFLHLWFEKTTGYKWSHLRELKK
jgi:hypothetical protein